MLACVLPVEYCFAVTVTYSRELWYPLILTTAVMLWEPEQSERNPFPHRTSQHI